MAKKRSDGRTAFELRPLRIEADVNPYADGSAEIQFGATRLLVVAQLEPHGSGIVRVQLAMLPFSTGLRTTETDSNIRKEISLIENITAQALQSSLEAAAVTSLDLALDVSVCVADGGVAAAAVAAGWVAMYKALNTAATEGVLEQDLNLPRVAAVSGGVVNEALLIDLLSEETAAATFHMLVCSSVLGGIVTIHAEGDAAHTTHETVSQLTKHCLAATKQIYEAQAKAVAE